MFIEQLKVILDREKVNISKLARFAGIQRTYIYFILNRGNDPNPATMEALVAGLSKVTGKRYELEMVISEKPTDTKYWVGIEIGVEKGGYSETELNCKGCFGPCGRCEELNKQPETAKN